MDYWRLHSAPHGILDNSNDRKINANILPKGKLPIWIREGPNVPIERLLAFIEENYVKKSSVTLIAHLKAYDTKQYKSWCKKWSNWKLRKIKEMIGCEDDCIVIIENVDRILIENISRAKKQLIFITTQNSKRG